MRSPVLEKLKKDLWEMLVIETFEISKIVYQYNRDPLMEGIPNVAEVFMKERVKQTYKILLCLKVLENSPEFRNLIEKFETRTLTLSDTAYEKPQTQSRNSLFHTPKYTPAELQKGVELLDTLVAWHIFSEDDSHPGSRFVNDSENSEFQYRGM